MARRLLIIGAGMASAYLLEALGRYDHDLAITVCGDEPDCCYNRVLLSSLLAGEVQEQDLDMPTPGQAKLVPDTRIERIDLARGQVITSRDKAIAFDVLVIATGASVATPDLPLEGVEGVLNFRSLEDARRLGQLPAKGRRAVVAGGGLLGLEAAHGLNARGFATTVVHRNPVLMNRQLDPEGASYLQRDLAQQGLAFELGRTIAELEASEGAVRAVRLDDGRSLDCDLLLFATGITPNISLAREAGLAVDRGIQVDAYLETNATGVYALGECAQFREHCFGLVAPIREQAAVLAASLSGQPGPAYQVSDTPAQLKISGTPIFRIGDLDGDAEQLLLRDPRAGIYRRLVVRDSRLVGAVLVGDKRGGSWYAELLRSRRNIDALRPGLMFGREIAEAGPPDMAAA